MPKPRPLPLKLLLLPPAARAPTKTAKGAFCRKLPKPLPPAPCRLPPANCPKPLQTAQISPVYRCHAASSARPSAASAPKTAPHRHRYRLPDAPHRRKRRSAPPPPSLRSAVCTLPPLGLTYPLMVLLLLPYMPL